MEKGEEDGVGKYRNENSCASVLITGSPSRGFEVGCAVDGLLGLPIEPALV